MRQKSDEDLLKILDDSRWAWRTPPLSLIDKVARLSSDDLQRFYELVVVRAKYAAERAEFQTQQLLERYGE